MSLKTKFCPECYYYMTGKVIPLHEEFKTIQFRCSRCGKKFYRNSRYKKEKYYNGSDIPTMRTRKKIIWKNLRSRS